MRTLRSHLPGLLVVAVIASAATVLGAHVPIVGAPVSALLAGAVLAALRPRLVADDGRAGPGLDFTRARLLQLAVVLLGLSLPFGTVLSVGHRAGVVVGGTLAVGAVCAALVGWLLGMDRDSATLVAVGTTICGASAIAAATAVIRPRRDVVALSLGIIFVFNIVAVLVFPPVGRMLGLSQEGFGLWAGTAINDTSSVLAAGVAFGPVAATFAVVVKLVRSLAIVPMCVGLHLARRNREPGERFALHKVVPGFVMAFLLASAVAATGVIPAAWNAPLLHTSSWLIAAVLAAVGTSLTWQRVRAAGARPLLFGGLLGLALAAASLGLQYAAGWR